MDDEGTEGETYPVVGKPWGVGYGERKWLTIRPDEEGKLVRRGFDYLLVSDKGAGEATVEITLHHQRRGKVEGTWDETPFLLHKLHAGEAIRLELDSDETLALYRHLQHLYSIGSQGTKSGERDFAVVEKSTIVATGSAAEQLRVLIQRHGQDGFLSAVSELDVGSGVVLLALLKKDYERKAAAVEEFEAHLAPHDDWQESDWQNFFERNDWIFGHGLDYRFLVTEVVQPNYGGADVTGRGGERGDFLLGSSGDVRFSVLVEIKRPDTELLGKKRYRNGAWEIGKELAAGAAQLQANCERWSRTATQDQNDEWTEESGVTTVQPKGILVIGHMRQLDIKAKVGTFQRFRRNLWNPEVVTYDELRDRARFLVARADQDASGLPHDVADEDPPDHEDPDEGRGDYEGPPDFDELPF
ncbi:MAG: hypothetical protein C0498_13010 [Anaerolinea sp.]|jgi:hypothetical protein|nr:hypothetical protein [Anaerolinea sp.]